VNPWPRASAATNEKRLLPLFSALPQGFASTLPWHYVISLPSFRAARFLSWSLLPAVLWRIVRVPARLAAFLHRHSRRIRLPWLGSGPSPPGSIWRFGVVVGRRAASGWNPADQCREGSLPLASALSLWPAALHLPRGPSQPPRVLPGPARARSAKLRLPPLRPLNMSVPEVVSVAAPASVRHNFADSKRSPRVRLCAPAPAPLNHASRLRRLILLRVHPKPLP